jgi:hypothetical protein
LLAPEIARADEVELGYRAAEGCPGPAQFVAGVADRGARFQGPEAVARVQRLDVQIEGKAGQFVGVLGVTDANGASSSRRIHDPSCADVVKGLAVIAAIALGAKDEAPVSESSPVASAPLEAPAQPAPPTPAPPAPLEPAEPERLRGSSLERLETLDVKAGTLRLRRDARYTLGAGIDYGLVPKLVLPRWEFTISSAGFMLPPGGESHLIGPILQVSWSVLGPATHRSGGYSTRVLAAGAELSSCNGLRYDSLGWTALLCGVFGAHWVSLETRSSDGAFEREKGTGIGHAGLRLDTQYSFNHWLYAGLRAGGRIQFGDTSATGADGRELFETPLFGAYATLGLGLRF